jgi:perosamine synthetase
MQVPYHRYSFDEAEEQAVLATMRSGWLTSGARVAEFETKLAQARQAQEAVALSSCTAGLFLLLKSANLPADSEVITSPMTFAASANVIVQAGLKPIFADVDPITLNIDPTEVEKAITPRTKAIIAVHLAGHPCALDKLKALCEAHQLILIEDCAHALEASYLGKSVGLWGRGGSFSFYPNKNITTGEGGAVITNDTEVVKALRIWRNHGLDRDSFSRENTNLPGQYDIVVPGYKLGMNEMQAALGICQLDKLASFTEARLNRVAAYEAGLADLEGLDWLKPLPEAQSAWHLFIVRLRLDALRVGREQIVQELLAAGIQVSLTYKPVHLFSFYRQLGFTQGQFSVAESASPALFSLPLYPSLAPEAQAYVIDILKKVILSHQR